MQHVPRRNVVVDRLVAALATARAQEAAQGRVPLQSDERQVGVTAENGLGLVRVRLDGDEPRRRVLVDDAPGGAHRGAVPDVPGRGGDGAVAVAEDGAGVFGVVEVGGGRRDVVEPLVALVRVFKVDFEFVDDEEEGDVGGVGGCVGRVGFAGGGGFGGGAVVLVLVRFVRGAGAGAGLGAPVFALGLLGAGNLRVVRGGGLHCRRKS